MSDDGLSLAAAVDRLEALVDTVESERMPVPVREVWVYGDVVLGLDPIDRLDVYITKDVLVRDDSESVELDADDSGTPVGSGTFDGHRSSGESGASDDPSRTFRESHGIAGVGSSVRADWARQHPEYLRANASGYAAPERCLAAHLLDDEEPIHLEVCNAGFEDNVTQRLRGARAREDYTQLLDPRGVCLWIDGVRSETAFEKLRESAFAMPTLSASLEMLGMDAEEASTAAKAVHAWREDREGATVRGDVV